MSDFPSVRIRGKQGGAEFDVYDFRDPATASPAGAVRDEVMRGRLTDGDITIIDDKPRRPRSTEAPA